SFRARHPASLLSWRLTNPGWIDRHANFRFWFSLLVFSFGFLFWALFFQRNSFVRPYRAAAVDGQVVAGQRERRQPGTGRQRQLDTADPDLASVRDDGQAIQELLQALTAEGAIQKEYRPDADE